MHNKEIERKVIKILSERLENRFTIKELSRILKIKKHKYKELVHTLYNLLSEGKIELSDKRYFIRKQRRNRLETSQCTGIFDATALLKNKSYAFVLCEGFDVFVSIEDIKDSYHGDEVLIEVIQKRNGKKYGKVIKVTKRKRDIIVGTIFKYKSKNILIPDDKKIHRDFKIINKNLHLNTGDKAILKVLNWGRIDESALPNGKIEKILGKSGDTDVEIMATIASLGLPLEFPQPVIKELKYITDETEENSKKRTDLRYLTTFTIDPPSAKDYDDAISLFDTENGYILYVHIADVAHYIKPKTELFNEAIQRGNSFYFPKMVIPMLPEKISNKICSLRPNEDKLTITVETHFDKHYAIIKQKVYESIIQSDARLTYNQVDELFENKKSDEIPEDIAEILFKMRKLSRKLSEQRIKRGYLSFYLPESEYEFDENGKIANLKRATETESHKLIENFMLIANEYTAKKLSHNHTIYRIHEQPDLKKLEELRGLLVNYKVKTKFNKNLNKMLQKILNSFPNEDYHIVFDRKILRSLKKAKYHIKNSGHFALAMPVYTHFTSPIRRLCDLIIHHQIKDFIRKQKPKFTKEDLTEFAKQATERENLADEGEKEVDIKYKQIFMQDRLGEIYEGIITNIVPYGIIVELYQYPISGIVPLSALGKERFDYYPKTATLISEKYNKAYKLMDKVKVQVAKVDDDIIFNLVKDDTL